MHLWHDGQRQFKYLLKKVQVPKTCIFGHNRRNENNTDCSNGDALVSSPFTSGHFRLENLPGYKTSGK